MPRIREKGIPATPKETRTMIPALFAWLEQLQSTYPKISTYEESINLAAVGATSYSTQTFTVTGLTTDDIITVNPPSLTSGLYLVSYYVSADDTLSMTFHNSTAGSINETPATYKIVACRV